MIEDRLFLGPIEGLEKFSSYMDGQYTRGKKIPDEILTDMIQTSKRSLSPGRIVILGFTHGESDEIHLKGYNTSAGEDVALKTLRDLVLNKNNKKLVWLWANYDFGGIPGYLIRQPDDRLVYSVGKLVREVDLVIRHLQE